jgi:hypothetical protein
MRLKKANPWAQSKGHRTMSESPPNEPKKKTPPQHRDGYFFLTHPPTFRHHQKKNYMATVMWLTLKIMLFLIIS